MMILKRTIFEAIAEVTGGAPGLQTSVELIKSRVGSIPIRFRHYYRGRYRYRKGMDCRFATAS